jgi:hypothetical protein
MTPIIEIFENLTYNPFESDCLFQNDDRDPDLNFFNEVKCKNLNCSYFTTDEVKVSLRQNNSNSNERYFNILHTNIRTRSLTKSIGILYRTRNIIGKKNLVKLYFAFVLSYINYACIAWASTNKTKLEPLFRRQKQAVSAINFKDRRTHTSEYSLISNLSQFLS